MSKATKRKYVTKEVLDEYVIPEGERQVVKVLESRGNNLHEVESASGDVFLVSMPTKFRKNVWIKRGDYVLVEPIAEGDKVKAEITHILYRPQIKYIQQQGLWPERFGEQMADREKSHNVIPDDMLPPSEDSDASDEADNHLLEPCNPNRHNALHETCSNNNGENGRHSDTER